MHTNLTEVSLRMADFNKKATLTPFKTVSVELEIDKPGEYGFQCGMGMLKGKLIVR